MADSMVEADTWDRSTIIPTRFISKTTLDDKCNGNYYYNFYSNLFFTFLPNWLSPLLLDSSSPLSTGEASAHGVLQAWVRVMYLPHVHSIAKVQPGITYKHVTCPTKKLLRSICLQTWPSKWNTQWLTLIVDDVTGMHSLPWRLHPWWLLNEIKENTIPVINIMVVLKHNILL